MSFNLFFFFPKDINLLVQQVSFLPFLPRT